MPFCYRKCQLVVSFIKVHRSDVHQVFHYSSILNFSGNLKIEQEFKISAKSKDRLNFILSNTPCKKYPLNISQSLINIFPFAMSAIIFISRIVYFVFASCSSPCFSSIKQLTWRTKISTLKKRCSLILFDRRRTWTLLWSERSQHDVERGTSFDRANKILSYIFSDRIFSSFFSHLLFRLRVEKNTNFI